MLNCTSETPSMHHNPKVLDDRLNKKYKVRRSSGRIETDWKLREAHIASQYDIQFVKPTDVVVVYKKIPRGGEMTKAVKLKEFMEMNPSYQV